MDAVAYQVSFDKEQLALLCANYDRRIDSLGAENKRLKAENAKLREERDHWHVEQVHAYGNWEDAHKRATELEAESDRLREQIHWLKKGDILHVLTDQEYIDQCERERLMQVSIDALDKENAKLREMIRELFRDFANADYELKSRCGRTFMAVTRYLPRLQELEVEP